MVTLEKVETEEMPENDTGPAEPEIKEDAVEEAVEEKEIEKEIVPRASGPEKEIIEKEKPAPKKRGRPKKEAAPPAEPKRRGRPPLPPKEPPRVPQPEPQIASAPPVLDDATLNQYLLKALMDHKRTSVLRREEHWRGLVKF